MSNLGVSAVKGVVKRVPGSNLLKVPDADRNKYSNPIGDTELDDAPVEVEDLSAAAGALFVSEAGLLQRTESKAIVAKLQKGKTNLPPSLLNATVLLLSGPSKNSKTWAITWAFFAMLGGVTSIYMVAGYIRHYDDPGDELETLADVIHYCGIGIVVLVCVAMYHLWTLSIDWDREKAFDDHKNKEGGVDGRVTKADLLGMLVQLELVHKDDDGVEMDITGLEVLLEASKKHFPKVDLVANNFSYEDTMQILEGITCEDNPDNTQPFLQSLLTMAVSDKCHVAVKNQRVKGWVLNGIVLLLSYYASITVFLSCLDETENQGRECPLKIKLAFGLNMIFSPIFVLGSFRAVYMLPTVLCQCLGNRALEICEMTQLKAWPRTAADYDLFAVDINRFQKRCQKLSAALEFSCVALPVMLGSLLAICFMILGLGSRPSELTHPNMEIFSTGTCGVLATLSMWWGLNQLSIPAKFNSRCSSIRDGLNSNRIKLESGSARFAVPENLTRITAAESYLDNTHVGFYAYGFQITHQLVTTCIVDFIVAVLTIGPMLMSIVSIPTLAELQCSTVEADTCEIRTQAAMDAYVAPQICDFTHDEKSALTAALRVFTNSSCAYNMTVDSLLGR